MHALKTESEMKAIARRIKYQLNRLGFLATRKHPGIEVFVSLVGKELPNGWLYLYTDSYSGYTRGETALPILKSIRDARHMPYSDLLSPILSGDFPDVEFEIETVSDKSISGNPLTVVSFETNRGRLYYAGEDGDPHTVMDKVINQNLFQMVGRKSKAEAIKHYYPR